MNRSGDVAFGDFNSSEHNHHHHDHHHDEDDDTNVLLAKAVTMTCLCMVSVVMGVIPMQVARCFKVAPTNQLVKPRSFKHVGVLLGFGGGVLFCTTFLHMLPEVEENVKNLTKKNVFPSLSFSLAKVFCCAGFFIMYLIEELVHARLNCKHPDDQQKSTTIKSGSKDTIYTNDSISAKNFNNVNANGNGCKKHDDDCEIGHAKLSHASCDIGHTHLNVIENCDTINEGALRGLLIVLGLSVHELFEGLAIGLESYTGHVWTMFGAVSAHKFIIAFCIGVELASSRTRTLLCYVYVFMFAVVSPLGIGIGMILTTGGGTTANNGSVAVVLQGLASGTLMYVVFFEILNKHRDGLIQYGSIIAGFAVMFVLQIFSLIT